MFLRKKSFKSSMISLFSILRKLVAMNFAGVPAIMELSGDVEKSLFTRLLLPIIVKSGSVTPPVMVELLHIQHPLPMVIG